MFEPVHGSAFDSTGDGIANPLAPVLSCELMFRHLGEDGIADTLRQGVVDQLADTSAPRTPDIGGGATTRDVVADLRSCLLS